jgi:LmbE family N-acetylglucosaminyl deacetylase
VYISGRTQSDYFVNIEDTIDIKVAALRAHKSQMKDWDPEPRVKEWASERGMGKEMAYAESFRIITLVDDETWGTRQSNS